MNKFYCQPGDVLLYCRSPNLTGRLIQDGEILEDGKLDREFYHAAVAVSAYEKIETAGWRVDIVPIDYGNFVLFRVPLDGQRLINKALSWSRTQLGRFYGYTGILDQALRDISGGRWSLPRRFIVWANKRWPFCSQLTAEILLRAGFNKIAKNLHISKIRLYPPPSPENLYLRLRPFELKEAAGS